MHTRRIAKTALALISVSVLCFGVFVGCKGDTDGGPASDDAGVGTQFVSDGGAGATIRIDVFGGLSVGETVDFIVTLLDPNGQPLPFIRIFCESERGIAILEPSAGGVAFESTASNGIMSGVLGGVAPGSYLLECRAEEGFNLVARQSIVITGEVPPGFNGFPGAAGGNLGGGLLVEEPNADVLSITAISFTDVSGDGLRIDVVQNPDCDGDLTTVDPEPFVFNNYVLTVANPFDEAISVGEVTFTAQGATSSQEFGLDIPGNSSGTITGLLTDTPMGASKQYAGTGVTVTEGTVNITFTVEVFNLLTGERFVITDTQAFSADNIDNC